MSSKPYLRRPRCYFGSAWPLSVQDDDSYGDDDFDKSEGGGGGRNSPGRTRGGGGGEFGGGKVPCEASEWPMSKRIKGLKALKGLSKANRCANVSIRVRVVWCERLAPRVRGCCVFSCWNYYVPHSAAPTHIVLVLQSSKLSSVLHAAVFDTRRKPR